MVTLKVNFTDEDLNKSSMLNVIDCAGYRAIKRIVPTLTSWAFSSGHAYINNTSYIVTIPHWAGKILENHASYSLSNNKSLKAKPFSCKITVPWELTQQAGS